jgi:hypothetical protein
MSKIEPLLARLEKVKGRNGSWTACCPAHADRSPSLAIRETPDGRILLHCFGGCSTYDVISALGMDMTDLFPDRIETDYSKPRKNDGPRFYASDLLRVIAFEATVVMVAARDVSRNKKLSESDMSRVQLACERIDSALRMADGNA